jgi:bacterial/archaeal transporter family-2 protein
VNNFYLAVAAAVGAGLAAQAAINVQLRAATGSALWAAILSASLTVALLVGAEVAARDPLQVAGWSRYPWWTWTGGIMGAAYVLAVVVLTRHLRVALLFAAIVVGQLLTGLLIDHFGWFGVAEQRLSPSRIIGAVLLIVGLALIRR